MKKTIAALAGITVSLPVAATAVWRRDSRWLQRRLLQAAVRERATFTADRLDAVPPPVRRFLARTLRDRQPLITTARVTQRGAFQLNGSWCPMHAHQLFSATPPAFIWDARIFVMRLLPVFVRDSYVDGQASMRASMLAVYPLVNQSGAHALNEGALLRFLGEAAWLPTRLLPGNGLSWQEVDDRAAIATLVDGQTSVSLQFRFDADGDLVELYSPDRFREVNGSYVPTPWRVRALGQTVVEGVRLMTPSVAEWLLPEGPLPYWRGRITKLEYQ